MIRRPPPVISASSFFRYASPPGRSWVGILQIIATVVAVCWAQAVAAAKQPAAGADEVTVAVTGDVFTSEGKAVSDAILAQPSVSAVLLAGDTSNDKLTPLSSYKKVYQGTFDRFLDKIYPCPGNHDGYSLPPFSGYREFWGKAAHAPQMYYSFDLGGWHIVSLDSVAFIKGDAAAAAQLEWLKKDLAAQPGKPVLAYWHYPFFSRAKHCGQPKVRPFWDVLYAHGPAIVINGHNHVYERFPPLDPNGNIVAQTKGIQEFQVSPGGAKPVANETPNVPGPASAKFHGNSQHVGFFTLCADGVFRYTIDSVAHDGTTTVVDSGEGNLSGSASREAKPKQKGPRRTPVGAGKSS